MDLSTQQYPRIGVTLLTESGDIIGLGDDDTYDEITFQIDVVSKKGVYCDGIYYFGCNRHLFFL